MSFYSYKLSPSSLLPFCLHKPLKFLTFPIYSETGEQEKGCRKVAGNLFLYSLLSTFRGISSSSGVSLFLSRSCSSACCTR